MDYKKYFDQTLKKRYVFEYSSIMIELEETYKKVSKETQFAFSSSNPLDKRMDFSAYFLSLIMVLEQHGKTYNEIKETCLEIVKNYVKPKSKFAAWLKKFPVKFIGLKLTQIFFKVLNKKISKKGDKDGFRAEFILDKASTYGLGYGIDIYECGICKLFQKHGSSKYAAILCEVDKYTTSMAGLELIRSGTIANGAAKCDFRYKKH